jgi:ATP-dependent helicase/nuclease subunit A
MREENATGEKIKYNGLKEFSLEESTKFTGAKRGTLIHTVLQQISQDANVKKINDYIEIIGATKEEKEYLHSQKYIFDRFINSELYAELERAKEIHTENPFFMDMPYQDAQDKVLVQGVIDLFFIDKDDRLILVDYKTDNVNSREELISRYEIQLKIYKDALERSLKRKVDAVYIYYTKLNEMIIIN